MWKEHLPSYFQLLESWFMRHHICNELEKFDLLLSAMTETQQCMVQTLAIVPLLPLHIPISRAKYSNLPQITMEDING